MPQGIGSASKQLVTGDSRELKIRYRRPHGTDWEDLDLDVAMDMIADRVIASRDERWQWESDDQRVRRTSGIASLGGATLDNEENYSPHDERPSTLSAAALRWTASLSETRPAPLPV